MLKQLAVPQKIVGAVILLFASSLLTEQASADEWTGTIAFLSNRDRDPLVRIDLAVYLIDANGFGIEILRENEIPWIISFHRFGPIAWSPDGKYIAYHMHDLHVPFVTSIYLETPVPLPVLVPGPPPTLQFPDPIIQFKEVTRGFGGQTYLSPKWSPDGKRLALTSTDRSRDGMTDVCVMDIEGIVLKNLTQSPGKDEVGSWSPDGSKIVFFSNRAGNGEIYVMGSNGRKQVNLTNHPALDAAPTWSPDGTQIAFQSNREGGQDDIYVMNPDGSNVVNLTRHPLEDRAPAWSPNGRWIAFHAFQVGQHPDIYVMDANGGNRAQLTKHPGSDTDPTWVIRDRSLSVEVSSNQVTLWGRMKLGRQ